MGLEDQVANLVQAANNLTDAIDGKVQEIDEKVTSFEKEAQSAVTDVTKDIRLAMVGIAGNPIVKINLLEGDDAGLLVQSAFNEGAKTVEVNWVLDGKERHWNSLVSMPVGSSLVINGPASTVGVVGGTNRTERACWARGSAGGISDMGSPLIFRNLTVSSKATPHNAHFRVYEVSSLISMSGNNIIVFGDGAYLHDEGGMIMSPTSGGLIQLSANIKGMPCYISGGGYNCNFYLSSGFVNQKGGGSDYIIRMQRAYFVKTSSDGPALSVNRGFRRLLNESVVGVTVDLLNMQPWEMPLDKAYLNDNEHADYGRSYYVGVRGINIQEDRPRLCIRNSWSFSGGIASIQCVGGFGEMADTGLERIGSSSEYRISF